jgi:vacuolar-type H+-ATPase subunit E/Vma4
LQNQSRIAILKAREDLIQKLRDQANEQLAQVAQNQEKYSKLLTNLIAQALYRLVEKDVFIKCREKDVMIVSVSYLLYLVVFTLPEKISRTQSKEHNSIIKKILKY